MLRILVIAEAANPEWVSVPLVGWNIYRALSRIANVHLVTHIRNRDSIRRAGLQERSDFTALDNERFASPLYKVSTLLRGGVGKGWTTVTALSSLAYYAFELEVWRHFESRLKAREFDIVHRVTPLSPTSQSLIARRLFNLDIPFVLGPLNGGVPWPRHFFDRQHEEREWLSHVRRLYKLMPAYRSTREFSSAIIVGSRFTASDMPNYARHKCIYIPENGIGLGQVPGLEVRRKCDCARGSRPLSAIFVGRLVPYKGADLLLEAAASFLRNNAVEVHIVGEGPQKIHLLGLVRELKIERNVKFHGLLSHQEVLDELPKHDFLALPSIREFGGGVVIEAMAMGVTPVVADYAGPAELVDESTGIRVPFSDRGSLIEGLRSAIAGLINDPGRLKKLGQAAREKVLQKFTWEAKANQIERVYSSVLSGRISSDLDFFPENATRPRE